MKNGTIFLGMKRNIILKERNLSAKRSFQTYYDEHIL